MSDSAAWVCECGHRNTGFASACYGGCGRERPSAATTALPQDALAAHVSRELQEIGVEHAIKVRPRYTVVRSHPEQRIDYSIQGIAKFKSVRDLAAALERVEADASYSAGSGWTFIRRHA